MQSHVNSYYAATLADAQEFEPLSADISVDACVVGGGLAGLSAARELAARGRSVALLEADRVGWGASGRNGGFVVAGYAVGVDVLAARLGPAHACELFQISREGVEIVRDNIAQWKRPDLQCGAGALSVARYDDEEELATAPRQLAEDLAYQVEFWPTDKVRAHLKTESYFQGLYDAEAIHIHPLNYTRALAGACAADGVRVFEGSPALALERDGNGFAVRSGHATVRCADVVLCHSAYGRGLNAAFDRAVLPVATYMVATRPQAGLLAEAIATDAAVADTRRAGDYYRMVPEGRLLWGGRITTQRSEPARLGAMLKRDIVEIYPQLSGIEIEYAWSGLMGYAVHKMPIIGALEPGIWIATAFGGHGLNTTAAAGRVIAEAIADGGDRHRLFDPFGTAWAGGPIGRAATQSVYWYYQLRDRIEENRAHLG